MRDEVRQRKKKRSFRRRLHTKSFPIRDRELCKRIRQRSFMVNRKSEIYFMLLLDWIKFIKMLAPHMKMKFHIASLVSIIYGWAGKECARKIIRAIMEASTRDKREVKMDLHKFASSHKKSPEIKLPAPWQRRFDLPPWNPFRCKRLKCSGASIKLKLHNHASCFFSIVRSRECHVWWKSISDWSDFSREH